jgi:hypothetical protein
VRTPVGVPRGLQELDPVAGQVAGLPALPSTELWLLDASDSGSPLAAELRALLVPVDRRCIAAASRPRSQDYICSLRQADSGTARSQAARSWTESPWMSANKLRDR